MWQVKATPPINPLQGWDYRHGYFPRNCYYKKDAEALAKEAISKGATNVSVVKIRK